MADPEILQPFSDREWKEMRAYVNGKNTAVPKWIEQDPGKQFKRMSAYLDALRKPTIEPGKAVEMPMDDCGLMINTGRDGTWLHFKTDTGRCASINVDVMAAEKGNIIGNALKDWCGERQAQAAAIVTAHG